MKKIVLTGGGSAGHVTPNLALIPRLIDDGWDVHYIGTENGIEHSILNKKSNITYHSVKSGKLRRYFDVKNFTDPFKVLQGIGQSVSLIKKIRPDVVFSKGGFVSVPVVIGAWMNHVPVVIHESDYTPGLANKISIPFAKKVCTTFPETCEHLKNKKGIFTGTPVREELFKGSRQKGLDFCGFTEEKPVLMMMGGSLGAVSINNVLRDIIKKLTEKFQVVHICGKGHIDHKLENVTGYRQFEYISDELPDIMAMADVIISRAGANSIYEFLALAKPNLLIPLPLASSRGDQILNAKSFEKRGFSKVLCQEDLNSDSLYMSILDVYSNKNKYAEKMKSFNSSDSVGKIIDVIYSCVK